MKGAPILAILTLVLAGCSAAPAAKSVDEPSNVAAPSDAMDGGATIEGLATDDEGRPIEGVRVGLVQLGLEVVSDAGGTFRFENVPAGTYSLAAIKLGYQSPAKSVTAVDGETAQITLILVPLAVEVAYQEVHGPLVGYFQCRSSVYPSSGTGACGYTCVVVCANPLGDVFTNDKSILRFDLTSDDVASVIGDMHWQPSAFGTSENMRFAFSYDERPSSHWWCAGEGPRPLQFVYHVDGDSQCANVGGADDPEVPVMKDNPMRVYSNVPFASQGSPVNLAYEQNFEIYATVFYGDPAPTGYTALSDA